jgi:hypothetical protein
VNETHFDPGSRRLCDTKWDVVVRRVYAISICLELSKWFKLLLPTWCSQVLAPDLVCCTVCTCTVLDFSELRFCTDKNYERYWGLSRENTFKWRIHSVTLDQIQSYGFRYYERRNLIQKNWKCHSMDGLFSQQFIWNSRFFKRAQII